MNWAARCLYLSRGPNRANPHRVSRRMLRRGCGERGERPGGDRKGNVKAKPVIEAGVEVALVSDDVRPVGVREEVRPERSARGGDREPGGRERTERSESGENVEWTVSVTGELSGANARKANVRPFRQLSIF